MVIINLGVQQGIDEVEMPYGEVAININVST